MAATGTRPSTLHNGVDIAQFSDAPDPSVLDAMGIPRQARIVGIVANYRPVKDLQMFLAAASQIAAHDARAVFLLVGQGPLRTPLGELAQELGIAKKVFFTNGAGSVASYLPLMEIGCLSSKSESFSNAILEYMAAGLPVVATDVGGNREAIVNGVTGVLTPVGQAGAFAKAVISLLDDGALRKAMGGRAKAHCREKFGMEACLRRLENYYESLLKCADHV
jgi:glycosyltransferase involved in cell wall biosynthesis